METDPPFRDPTEQVKTTKIGRLHIGGDPIQQKKREHTYINLDLVVRILERHVLLKGLRSGWCRGDGTETVVLGTAKEEPRGV